MARNARAIRCCTARALAAPGTAKVGVAARRKVSPWRSTRLGDRENGGRPVRKTPRKTPGGLPAAIAELLRAWRRRYARTAAAAVFWWNFQTPLFYFFLRLLLLRLLLPHCFRRPPAHPCGWRRTTKTRFTVRGPRRLSRNAPINNDDVSVRRQVCKSPWTLTLNGAPNRWFITITTIMMMLITIIMVKIFHEFSGDYRTATWTFSPRVAFSGH